jgi:hypothetical protein
MLAVSLRSPSGEGEVEPVAQGFGDVRLRDLVAAGPQRVDCGLTALGGIRSQAET